MKETFAEYRKRIEAEWLEKVKTFEVEVTSSNQEVTSNNQEEICVE